MRATNALSGSETTGLKQTLSRPRISLRDDSRHAMARERTAASAADSGVDICAFKDVSWLSLDQPQSAMFSVALSSVWQNLGLTFIIVLAALQAVPDELNEAATLDGFSAVRRFFRITVPLISPA